MSWQLPWRFVLINSTPSFNFLAKTHRSQKKKYNKCQFIKFCKDRVEGLKSFSFSSNKLIFLNILKIISSSSLFTLHINYYIENISLFQYSVTSRQTQWLILIYFFKDGLANRLRAYSRSNLACVGIIFIYFENTKHLNKSRGR